MAKISLRAYNREIEQLITRGQTDEAVAHCKYILKLFPKHIDTYRLLGKAYLESQHYADAADILQRILSVVPDDFVSQLGMSIVREDEGNLDAAIWHMERAFEIQPMNKAVQDELRRLYGRRDGVEPPRVRNTRGALVRMYARGELYPQAIAEARAALTEDPRRIDLEIILARSYYLSGQMVEATEICSRLINRLPFCYEANHILGDILPKTSRGEDAKVYQQNVKALDPYAAFLSPNTPTIDQIPENAVTLERLEWQESIETSQQPDWAKSVGVQVQEQEQTLPDWLVIPPSALTPAQAQDKPSSITPPPAPSVIPPAEPASSAAALPDWMKSAGWNESNGEVKETPPVEDFSAEEPLPAEIPDWLKSMQPAPQKNVESAAPDESENLDFLKSMFPESPAAPDPVVKEVPNLAPETAPTTPEAAAAPIPPTLDMPEQIPQAESNLTAEPQLPDWLLEEINATRTAVPPQAPPPQTNPPVESATKGPADVDQADWFTQHNNQPDSTASASDEIPDWLAAVGEVPASTQPAADLPPTSPSSNVLKQPAEPDEIPDWLKDFQSPVVGSSDSGAGELGTLPTWLQAANSSQSPTAAQPAGQPVESLPPDLVAAPAEELVAHPQEISSPEDVVPAADAVEIPDWLKAHQTTQEPLAAEETPMDELPDWLKEIKSSAAPAESPVQTPPAQPPQGLTDWLLSGDQPQSAQAPQSGVTTPATAESAPQAASVPLSQAEPEQGLPDWLLASHEPQPAQAPERGAIPPAPEEFAPEAASMPSSQVEPAQGLPDWLLSGDEPQSAHAPESGEISPAVAEEALPQSASVPPSQTESMQSLPDWLLAADESKATQAPEIGEIPVAATEAAPQALNSPSSEAVPAEGLPDWLLELDRPQISQAQAAPEQASQEQVPQELAGQDQIEQTPEAGTVPASLEANPAEASSPTSEPAKVVDNLPDWLLEIDQTQTPSSAELPVAPTVPGNIEPAPDMSTPTGTAPQPAVQPEGYDEDLAWLESLAARQGASEETLLTKPGDRQETMPGWIKDSIAASDAQVTQTQPESQHPEAEATAEIPPVQENPPSSVVTAPLVTPTPPAAQLPAQPPIEDLDAALAWLESLAAGQGASEETLLTKPEERTSTPPAWVSAETEAAAAENQVSTSTPPQAEIVQPEGIPQAQPVEQAHDEIVQPDILSPQTVVTNQAEAVKPTAKPAQEPSLGIDADLAWLESLAARQGASEETLLTKPEDRQDELPDWLKQEMESADVQPVASQEEPAPVTAEQVQSAEPTLEPRVETAAPSTEHPSTVPAMSEEDAAFSWLEGLAAHQGASEDSLLNKPEDRSQEPPAWVLESAEEEKTQVAAPSATDAQVDQTQISAEVKPALEQQDTAPFTSEVLGSERPTQPLRPLAEERLPDWLQGLTSESSTMQSNQDETPAWMQDAQMQAEIDQFTPDQAVAPVPEPADEKPSIEDTQPVSIQPKAETVRSAEVVVPPPTQQTADGSSSDLFQRAHAALDGGDVEKALEDYHQLIEGKQMLGETIDDLKNALYRHPVDISLWEALGDAYMKNNQIQEALDTYTKAEELLR